MTILDAAIVFVYLLLLFMWAIWMGLRETADDYLVFSRKAPFILVTFSLTSTWVGIGTTVATAAGAYSSGISIGIVAASAGVVGAIVAAFFAPRLKWFGDTYSAHTIGDFYGLRYSPRARQLAGTFILIVYCLLAAAQFVGLATLLSVWTGLRYEVMVWFAASSTIIYTAYAGLKSDFYTDGVHFIVMSLVLFLILLPVTIARVGLTRTFTDLPAGYLDPFAYGGVSFFIAGLIFGSGSMFITMEIWQRIYASESRSVARRSLYVAAFAIVAFYVVSTYFGLVAKVSSPNLGDRDQALFAVMKTFLPTGLLGLGIAGFMAIFVSTVNSMLMVLSATITKDFYLARQSQNIEPARILRFSRVATLLAGLVALAVALIVPDLVSLAINALFMLLILVPSVVGGFFWAKSTSNAAELSIILGALVLVLLTPRWPEQAFVPAFLVAATSFVAVSLLTKHQRTENMGIVRGWLKTTK